MKYNQETYDWIVAGAGEGLNLCKYRWDKLDKTQPKALAVKAIYELAGRDYIRSTVESSDDESSESVVVDGFEEAEEIDQVVEIQISPKPKPTKATKKTVTKIVGKKERPVRSAQYKKDMKPITEAKAKLATEQKKKQSLFARPPVEKQIEEDLLSEDLDNGLLGYA